MKGRWSISCNEPAPQRSSGARPPSTQTGEQFAWAPAIALTPLVTPGPAVSAADPEPSRRLREPLSGEHRGLLMPHVDDLDPLIAAPVVDREQVPAGEREQVADAARLQRLARHPSPIQRSSARSDAYAHIRLASGHAARDCPGGETGKSGSPQNALRPSGACGFAVPPRALAAAGRRAVAPAASQQRIKDANKCLSKPQLPRWYGVFGYEDEPSHNAFPGECSLEASALTHASQRGLLARRSPLLKLQGDERLIAMARQRKRRRLRDHRRPLPGSAAGLLPPDAGVHRGRRGRPPGGLRQRLPGDARRSSARSTCGPGCTGSPATAA